MKKTLIIVTLVSVIILSLAATGLVFAQEGVQPGEGKGNGVLREYIHAAVAAELGMSVEELEAAIEAGQKPHEIAEEQGIDEEAFRAMMETAFQNALGTALADGAITQEEYDAIQERGFRGPGGRGHGKGKIAELLGLTQEELQARLDAGESIEEIAEELGVELPERREGRGPNVERLAEVLGIGAEEVQQRLDDGQTVQEMAEELGVELPQRPEGRGPGGPGGQDNNFPDGIGTSQDA